MLKAVTTMTMAQELMEALHQPGRHALYRRRQGQMENGRVVLWNRYCIEPAGPDMGRSRAEEGRRDYRADERHRLRGERHRLRGDRRRRERRRGGGHRRHRPGRRDGPFPHLPGRGPGVGKTYAMLTEGQRRRARATDVAARFVERYGL